MREVFAEGDDWYARVAGPEDDDVLLRLLLDVPMGGAVATVQDRTPDFRAWMRAQGGIAETGLVCRRRDDAPVGLGSSVVRPTLLPDGTVAPTGYLFDIRMLPEWRGARVAPAMARGSLERLRRLYGVEVCTTAIADSNAPVRRAATSRQPLRAAQPVARPAFAYDMVSVLAPRRPRRAQVRVEAASASDLDEVAAYLGDRTPTWGEPVDRKTLDARLRRWPGLTAGAFLVARRDGAVVGCAAPWDASPVRRLRVHAYRRWLRALRPLVGAVGRVRGIRPLPAPGEALRFATLSHLAADDAGTFAALLDAAWPSPAAREVHFLAALVPRGSPLAEGTRGFPATRLAMTMLAMAIPGTRWATAPLDAPRCGFEMALA